MKSRIALMVTALAVISLLLGSAQAGASNPSISNNTPLTQAQVEAKIAPALLTQAHNDANASVRYMVHMAQQADTSNTISPLNWKEKGDYVYNKLRATAESSQAGLRGQLTTMSGSGSVTRVEPLWIDNVVYVEGKASTLYSIASRPEVASISEMHTFHVDGEEVRGVVSPIQPSVVMTDYGITNIKADQVWNLGYFGQGVTVGDIDTGLQYDHPAIVDHYRGTHVLPGHDYNWFDAVGHQGVPYDDSDHGTHTAGTIVGLDAAGQNVIGVAPKANLIACKGLDGGSRGGDNFELLLCAQWMLAPTDVNGNNPRPELRPNVVNNSWGGADGSAPDFYYPIQQWLNAGIFPAFANGNAGPGAQTVGVPGNLPVAFSVGATSSTDHIAGFSSRGPSPYDGGLKPNISAPGVNTRSSVPTNQYASFSGTSMATPHIVGVVALLLSKNKGLSVNDLENAITSTAYISTFMGTIPNNNYGWGRVDALAAANSVPAFSGSVVGHVTDGSNAVAGAYISWPDNSGYGNSYGVSDATGAYTITLPPGFQTLRAAKFGYTSQDAVVNVMNGMTTTQDFTITTTTTGNVSGVIHLASNNSAISGTLMVNAPGIMPSGHNGSYSLDLPNGDYDITLRPEDNCLAPQTAHVTVNGSTVHDFLINPKRDNFGYSCQTGTVSNYISATNTINTWVGPPFGGAAPRYDGTVTTTLPFNFHYYGTDYSSVHINTDGYVHFGPATWSEGGNFVPFPALPNASILAFSGDLDLDLDPGAIHHGDVYTDVIGTAPNRQYVIEWRHTTLYVDQSTDFSFEILLGEDGDIQVQYLTMVTGRAANLQVVGIENATGTDGIQHSFNIPGAIHDGLLIHWMKPATDPTPTVTPGGPAETPLPTETPLVTPTATNCANPFLDINGNVFYNAIMYLYCRGVVNGTGNNTYSPAGTSTRAQFAKVVVLGFGIADYTPAVPDFTDVPANYFAYSFIEAGFHAGILSGFDPATCALIGAQDPCYGPNRPITRAQLTKLVVAAGGFAPFTPTSPTFTDVGTNNVFYASIETAHHYGIINGYPDNTFRPNNNIRRDEMAQIVYKGVTAP